MANASATTRSSQHVAAWEFQGEGKTPLRNIEPLNYEFTKMSVRNPTSKASNTHPWSLSPPARNSP